MNWRGWFNAGARRRSSDGRGAVAPGAPWVAARRSRGSRRTLARDPRERQARTLRAGAHNLLAVSLPAWRSKFMLFVLFCAFSALALRAFYLQGGAKTDFLQGEGDKRYARTLQVPGTRGMVTDRNGVVLAASLPARAIWAAPDALDATPAQIGELARLLDMPVADLKRRVADNTKRFVYLRRQVEPELAAKVAALNIDGVDQVREFKRHYPEGATVAQVVGFTNTEDRGQEGVELAFDDDLAARTGSRRVIKDGRRIVVEDNWLREPADGRPVRLTIDHRIQYIAFTALRDAVRANNARAGAVVVLDTARGEVLALANWPAFDPNQRGSFDADLLRNRALTDTFEPGSTLKPFSIAAALEAGSVTPTTTIQTAPGTMTIGDRTIHDHRMHGLLTVEQIVAQSSNVGTAKIVLELPAARLWELYTGVGFGQPPRVGIPGAVAGRLRPAKAWRPIEQATIAFGYGVSVSLMQLANAYLIFARDGDLVPASLRPVETAPVPVRVVSVQTAQAMRKMLELAVSDEGTAPAARIPGYRVAGKTGTAYKLVGGRYTKNYIASFAGMAPANEPRVVIAVMIDEPNAGRHYGGDVAAPVFAQIAAGVLRLLQVPPDASRMLASAADGAAAGEPQRLRAAR